MRIQFGPPGFPCLRQFVAVSLVAIASSTFGATTASAGIVQPLGYSNAPVAFLKAWGVPAIPINRVKTITISRRVVTQVIGRGTYICSHSGAGMVSRCTVRMALNPTR